MGDTGLTLETGTEGSGYRPSPGTLSGVAASTWLPLAHPAGRRHRTGQSRAWGHSRVWWGQLPHLPGVGAAWWGLAVGRQHLLLSWLITPMADSVVIPGRGAQQEQGPANRNPQLLSPACGPQRQPQLSRALEPGSPSGLTRHCSLSPAGPPAASAPRRRGRRTAKVPARARGSLGHTAAPPRSLRGLSAPALPHTHPCTPFHPGREPSLAHPAPLPAGCRSTKCSLRPRTCSCLCPHPCGAHQPL